MMLERETLQQLLQAHRSAGIGLHHSVGFLCRVQGVELKAAAREAGVSRGLLYFALRGERRATDRVRQAVEKHLGVDPWLVGAGGAGS